MVRVIDTPLAQWMRKNKLNARELGEALGVSTVSVWRWARGMQEIDLPNAIALHRYTNGAIKFEDMVLDR